MSEPLARLRMDLDLMPSPVSDRPGLLIRDPYQFSDATLIIPPPLIECLRFFDGKAAEIDLREHLVRVTGELDVGKLIEHLRDTLSEAGFLDNEVYQGLKRQRQQEFADAPVREPSHAGSAYPAETDPLRQALNGYLDGDASPSSSDNLIGIAAPHVSPEGGWQIYKSAYRALSPDYKDRLFVILGTSHYGAPDRFGLTRKPFRTPYGDARTEVSLVDRLASRVPNAVEMEDYCHATEHSIEFQVLFLQHLYGADVRILPILCGSYARSIYQGGSPEDNDAVAGFLGELGEIAAAESKKLCWILGVDMAHMGRRYGDTFAASANTGEMEDVAKRDRDRIERINAGDADGFWNLVKENRDDLKWCGSAPFYTFLRAVPDARASLLDYQQWNIDEQSIVSFASLTFQS